MLQVGRFVLEAALTENVRPRIPVSRRLDQPKCSAVFETREVMTSQVACEVSGG